MASLLPETPPDSLPSNWPRDRVLQQVQEFFEKGTPVPPAILAQLVRIWDESGISANVDVRVASTALYKSRQASLDRYKGEQALITEISRRVVQDKGVLTVKQRLEAARVAAPSPAEATALVTKFATVSAEQVKQADLNKAAKAREAEVAAAAQAALLNAERARKAAADAEASKKQLAAAEAARKQQQDAMASAAAVAAAQRLGKAVQSVPSLAVAWSGDLNANLSNLIYQVKEDESYLLLSTGKFEDVLVSQAVDFIKRFAGWIDELIKSLDEDGTKVAKALSDKIKADATGFKPPMLPETILAACADFVERAVESVLTEGLLKRQALWNEIKRIARAVDDLSPPSADISALREDLYVSMSLRNPGQSGPLALKGIGKLTYAVLSAGAKKAAVIGERIAEVKNNRNVLEATLAQLKATKPLTVGIQTNPPAAGSPLGVYTRWDGQRGGFEKALEDAIKKGEAPDANDKRISDAKAWIKDFTEKLAKTNTPLSADSQKALAKSFDDSLGLLRSGLEDVMKRLSEFVDQMDSDTAGDLDVGIVCALNDPSLLFDQSAADYIALKDKGLNTLADAANVIKALFAIHDSMYTTVEQISSAILKDSAAAFVGRDDFTYSVQLENELWDEILSPAEGVAAATAKATQAALDKADPSGKKPEKFVPPPVDTIVTKEVAKIVGRYPRKYQAIVGETNGKASLNKAFERAKKRGLKDLREVIAGKDDTVCKHMASALKRCSGIVAWVENEGKGGQARLEEIKVWIKHLTACYNRLPKFAGEIQEYEKKPAPKKPAKEEAVPMSDLLQTIDEEVEKTTALRLGGSKAHVEEAKALEGAKKAVQTGDASGASKDLRPDHIRFLIDECDRLFPGSSSLAVPSGYPTSGISVIDKEKLSAAIKDDIIEIKRNFDAVALLRPVYNFSDAIAENFMHTLLSQAVSAVRSLEKKFGARGVTDSNASTIYKAYTEAHKAYGDYVTFTNGLLIGRILRFVADFAASCRAYPSRMQRAALDAKVLTDDVVETIFGESRGIIQELVAKCIEGSENAGDGTVPVLPPAEWKAVVEKWDAEEDGLMRQPFENVIRALLNAEKALKNVSATLENLEEGTLATISPLPLPLPAGSAPSASKKPFGEELRGFVLSSLPRPAASFGDNTSKLAEFADPSLLAPFPLSRDQGGIDPLMLFAETQTQTASARIDEDDLIGEELVGEPSRQVIEDAAEQSVRDYWKDVYGCNKYADATTSHAGVISAYYMRASVARPGYAEAVTLLSDVNRRLNYYRLSASVFYKKLAAARRLPIGAARDTLFNEITEALDQTRENGFFLNMKELLTSFGADIRAVPGKATPTDAAKALAARLRVVSTIPGPTLDEAAEFASAFSDAIVGIPFFARKQMGKALYRLKKSAEFTLQSDKEGSEVYLRSMKQFLNFVKYVKIGAAATPVAVLNAAKAVQNEMEREITLYAIKNKLTFKAAIVDAAVVGVWARLKKLAAAIANSDLASIDLLLSMTASKLGKLPVAAPSKGFTGAAMTGVSYLVSGASYFGFGAQTPDESTFRSEMAKDLSVPPPLPAAPSPKPGAAAAAPPPAPANISIPKTPLPAPSTSATQTAAPAVGPATSAAVQVGPSTTAAPAAAGTGPAASGAAPKLSASQALERQGIVLRTTTAMDAFEKVYNLAKKNPKLVAPLQAIEREANNITFRYATLEDPDLRPDVFELRKKDFQDFPIEYIEKARKIELLTKDYDWVNERPNRLKKAFELPADIVSSENDIAKLYQDVVSKKDSIDPAEFDTAQKRNAKFASDLSAHRAELKRFLATRLAKTKPTTLKEFENEELADSQAIASISGDNDDIRDFALSLKVLLSKVRDDANAAIITRTGSALRASSISGATPAPSAAVAATPVPQSPRAGPIVPPAAAGVPKNVRASSAQRVDTKASDMVAEGIKLKSTEKDALETFKRLASTSGNARLPAARLTGSSAKDGKQTATVVLMFVPGEVDDPKSASKLKLESRHANTAFRVLPSRDKVVQLGSTEVHLIPVIIDGNEEIAPDIRARMAGFFAKRTLVSENVLDLTSNSLINDQFTIAKPFNKSSAASRQFFDGTTTPAPYGSQSFTITPLFDAKWEDLVKGSKFNGNTPSSAFLFKNGDFLSGPILAQFAKIVGEDSDAPTTASSKAARIGEEAAEAEPVAAEAKSDTENFSDLDIASEQVTPQERPAAAQIAEQQTEKAGTAGPDSDWDGWQ